MSTTCPSNSTECLLRAIISNTDQGYNWNPLNFAFTAALSILAFVIAVIGLLQALVSAGPGRLKASLGALGPVYSDKAKTRFDRTELRFRTVAAVPVINVDKILAFYGDKRYVEDEKASGLRSQPLVHPVAGWALLLQELFLTDVPFKTVPNLTDYLPSDVLAAPALASVESLLVLGIMRGCDQLREDQDGWITALGPSRQIDFVVHPGIGPIGTYRNFTYAERTLAYDHGEICGLIYECLGLLRFDNKVVFEPVFRPSMDMDCRLHWYKFEDILNDALSVCSHHHARCRSRRGQVKSSDCYGLFSRDNFNSRDVFIMTALMMADTPWLVKAFPSKGIQLHRLVSAVKNDSFSWLWEAPLKYELESLLGGSKLAVIADQFMTGERFDHRQMPMGRTSWALSCGRQTIEPVTRPILRPAKGLVELLGSNEALEWTCESDDMRISEDAVSHALSWLADSEYFIQLQNLDARRARYWLRFQLAEIDWWLAEHAGIDAICAVANIAYHTPFMLNNNEGDLMYDRPTYIKCKAKFLLPETLDFYKLPWDRDPRDPSYVIVKQYIDPGLQDILFKHTRNIMLHRRNVGRARTSMSLFHTVSALSGHRTSSLSHTVSPSPDQAIGDPSGRDPGTRVQERQMVTRPFDVWNWNENQVPSRNASPPPPSPPDSIWDEAARSQASPHTVSPRRRRSDGFRTDTRSVKTEDESRRPSSIDAGGIHSVESTRHSHEDVNRVLRLHLELPAYTALPPSPQESSPDDDQSSSSKDVPFHARDQVSLATLSRQKIAFESSAVDGYVHWQHRTPWMPDPSVLSAQNIKALDRRNNEHGQGHMEPDFASNTRAPPVPSHPPSDTPSKAPSNNAHHQSHTPPPSTHSRPSTKGTVFSSPDPRMKAMETLLFFRAVLFAALLASASDSTVLLKSEKRKQVVQVL